jgi:hypothetical protein
MKRLSLDQKYGVAGMIGSMIGGYGGYKYMEWYRNKPIEEKVSYID